MQGSLLALDIGERRIGVALANAIARIASPHATLINDADFTAALQRIVTQEQVSVLVCGLPRGIDGQETSQTLYVRNFVQGLERDFPELPIVLQDEALTSRMATDELESRGKPYNKGDVDALAATFILQDYLQTVSAGGAA